MHETRTKYFTASKTKNYGNEFFAFEQYIMEELNDQKNRLEVLSSFGNASYSYEATEILKEQIEFLREDKKNKTIKVQSIKENENLHFLNKD